MSLRTEVEAPNRAFRIRTGDRRERRLGFGLASLGSNPKWMPWIFAAKTTASGLLALLIAFTFNLDQPKWALLTVFIVAQPQSGLVLAKSFYRLLGTFVGAAVALLLVSLFAQERVLFLGSLALWIGICTFISVHWRNFAAYGFVLSGYTVAIVGVTGALDPTNAFFVAEARVTEISLGIIVVATISHLVFQDSLSQSLRRAIAEDRVDIAKYASAVLAGDDDATLLRAKLLAQPIAIESMRASAVFEDPELRDRSAAIRTLAVAMLGVLDVAQLLGRSMEDLGSGSARLCSGLVQALSEAKAAIDLWWRRASDIDGLKRGLVAAGGALPRAQDLSRDPSARDPDVIRCGSVIVRLREFFAALVAFAEAYEAFLSSRPEAARPPRFAVSNDRPAALWAGARAAMALLLASAFWILADWPSGSTAAILAGVVTARLAIMEHAAQAATGGSLVIALATIPAFVLVQVLLPHATGFEMFALVTGPWLFFSAYLMAFERTEGIGFLAGLYFAHVAGFQDQMAYDPVGFINISIACVVAVATAAVLFMVVAPDTPEAARRRFLRAVRREFSAIERSPRASLDQFETRIMDALDQLRRALPQGRAGDMAPIEAGVGLFGLGRRLIRIRDHERCTARRVAGFIANDPPQFDRARAAAADALAACLANLGDRRLDQAEARVAAQHMAAFAAVADALERSGPLLEMRGGVRRHVA